MKKIEKIIFLNNYLFSPLLIAAFASSIIDAVSYEGFFRKLTGVPASFFMILAFLSSAIIFFDQLFFHSKTKIREIDLVLSLNIIVLPFATFIFYALNQLEAVFYPNYVFSTMHIHLSVFTRTLGFSVFLGALKLIKNFDIDIESFDNDYLKFKTQKEGNNITNLQVKLHALGLVLFVISLTSFFSFRGYSIFNSALNDMARIMRTPFASWEERKTQQFGTIYGTYKFIKEKTEPDSIIAVPPQNRWMMLGNIGFSRYFLYPRFLIHPEDYTSESMPKIDYFIIGDSHDNSDGTMGDIWPESIMEGKKIYLYNEILGIEEPVDTNIYDPTNPIFRDKWGVIKL